MLSPQMKKVQKARTSLLLDQPFFGVLALNLHMLEDPSAPTAWTDGKSIGWNPAFVDQCSNDELMAVMAHEVMHCACGHPWRRNQRDPLKWNYAADYAINSILSEPDPSGKPLFTLPADCLNDPQYRGKWAEWIFDRIPQPPSQGGQSGGKGGYKGGKGQSQGPGQSSPGGHPGQPGQAPGGMGEVRDAPSGADAPSEADWQQATEQAAKGAQRGTLPGKFREALKEATRSRVDWISMLTKYAQDVVRADYTWMRPNVRYIQQGLYLPALRSHACGRFVIGCDTSGSIDTVLLQQFQFVIRAIAEMLQPSSIDVIYCDAKVHRVDTFERGDQITMEAVGRGGTSFVPVFEHVAKSGEIPAVLIYLTDMQGTFPQVGPEYPVIWAAYGGETTAPFGDVVPCE